MIKFIPLLQGLSIIHIYSQKKLSRQSEHTELVNVKYNEINLLYGADMKNNTEIEFKYSEPKKLVYIEKFLLEYYICNRNHYNIFYKTNAKLVYWDYELISLIDDVISDDINDDKFGNIKKEKEKDVKESAVDILLNKLNNALVRNYVKKTENGGNIDKENLDLNSSNSKIIMESNNYAINKNLFFAEIIKQSKLYQNKFDDSLSKISSIPKKNMKDMRDDISNISFKESYIFNDQSQVSYLKTDNLNNNNNKDIVMMDDLFLLETEGKENRINKAYDNKNNKNNKDNKNRAIKDNKEYNFYNDQSLSKLMKEFDDVSKISETNIDNKDKVIKDNNRENKDTFKPILNTDHDKYQTNSIKITEPLNYNSNQNPKSVIDQDQFGDSVLIEEVESPKTKTQHLKSYDDFNLNENKNDDDNDINKINDENYTDKQYSNKDLNKETFNINKTENKDSLYINNKMQGNETAKDKDINVPSETYIKKIISS